MINLDLNSLTPPLPKSSIGREVTTEPEEAEQCCDRGVSKEGSLATCVFEWGLC